MYELIRLEWPKQLELESPLSDAAKLFEPLVPKQFHCCLRGKDPSDISDTSIIAIGAIFQGQPVGIALASCYRHIHKVTLHYISVLPEHRNQHIGRQMLEKLQISAKTEGGRYYIFCYKFEDPSTPALEKMLTACEWKTSQPFMIECLYNSFTFNPPWIHTPYKLPSAMEIFPWRELSADEKNQIFRDERRGVVPFPVLPFRKEHLIEPLNSLGLRFEGRVIGWIITHREAPDKIVYHALYIERSFHFMGPGIKLLIDSMLIQKTLPIQWAAFELPLVQVQPAWIQFVNRRLVPYADVVTHYVQAYRSH